MFNCRKLCDLNFSFTYTRLFSFKILVVFGYIALLFNMLISFFTDMALSWGAQLLFYLLINVIGLFFVLLILLVYLLFFVSIIVDLTLFFSKKATEEDSKKEVQKSMPFLVLNSFIFLYALWYLGFNILIFLFLVSVICLIKYLFSKNIEKNGLLIRLGVISILLLLMSRGIVEGIIFDKGHWSTKYLFKNEIIENVNLMQNAKKIMFLTTPKDGSSIIVNKIYTYNLNKGRFEYKKAFINENILNAGAISLNNDEELIIRKKNIKGKSIIDIDIYNNYTKDIKNIRSLDRKILNEEIVLLRNGHILMLPVLCRSCENYEVYNPQKNELYSTKNKIEGYIDIRNVQIFSNGNLLIPSGNKFYIYDLEENIFNKGANIKINDKCALYKDEYIFNFQDGYKYSFAENTKKKIRKLKNFKVEKAIALDNGNFLIAGTEKRHKLLGKYNPRASYFQNTETYKIYLYITKRDYYVQLKSFNSMWKEYSEYNSLKLENGDILFWNKKNNDITIYKNRKDK